MKTLLYSVRLVADVQLVSVQKAFRRWVQHGPLSTIQAAITPNPSLTVPTTYVSPKKRREQQQSGLNSPVGSFNTQTNSVDAAAAAAAALRHAIGTGSPLVADRNTTAVTPGSALLAAKRLRLDEVDTDSDA